MTASSTEEWIRAEFEREGLAVVAVDTRTFPQEAHHIVFVPSEQVGRALVLGNKLKVPATGEIDEFVIVRAAPSNMLDTAAMKRLRPVRNVHDERCSQLINLVSARSQVSSAQPSLAYVPDARANLAAVTATRHHLIFGRRGAGKTALLVEARRQLDEGGAITAWTNIQTYRREYLSGSFYMS